jgi:hypothetical protein
MDWLITSHWLFVWNRWYSILSNVAEPDPDPQDPYRMFLRLLDPDPVVRGTDPDPSIIKQK